MLYLSDLIANLRSLAVTEATDQSRQCPPGHVVRAFDLQSVGGALCLHFLRFVSGHYLWSLLPTDRSCCLQQPSSHQQSGEVGGEACHQQNRKIFIPLINTGVKLCLHFISILNMIRKNLVWIFVLLFQTSLLEISDKSIKLKYDKLCKLIIQLSYERLK